MAIRLSGWSAIALAEQVGCLLSAHAHGAEPARDDVSVDEARAMAEAQPERVFVDVDEPAPSDTGVA